MESEENFVNIESLIEDDIDSISVEIIEHIENELESARERRRVERFLWIIAVAVLIDALIFPPMESFSGPLVIGILELIALFLIARAMGLREISEFLDQLIDRVSPNSRK